MEAKDAQTPEKCKQCGGLTECIRFNKFVPDYAFISEEDCWTTRVRICEVKNWFKWNGKLINTILKIALDNERETWYNTDEEMIKMGMNPFVIHWHNLIDATIPLEDQLQQAQWCVKALEGLMWLESRGAIKITQREGHPSFIEWEILDQKMYDEVREKYELLDGTEWTECDE